MGARRPVTQRDPGLQPERTALAWRRTSLALVVGSLSLTRFLPWIHGDLMWVVAGTASALTAYALCTLGRRRAESMRFGPPRRDRAATAADSGATGAAALAALAGFVAVGGAAALVTVAVLAAS